MVIRMEANLSLKLVKIFRIYLKLIPIVLATLSFLNCVIAYFGLELKLLAHAFMFFLISFIYIASYVLKFCEYHRMFLHYIVVIYIINCVDYYIGIPFNDIEILITTFILTFIMLVITLYLRLKRI